MTGNERNRKGLLKSFVTEHPEGWDHGSWEGLLEELEAAGISTEDPQSIGRELEYERLSQMLEGLRVKGIGPKRRQVLVTTYGRVWELRGAPAGEIARLPSFNPKLAEQLVEALP